MPPLFNVSTVSVPLPAASGPVKVLAASRTTRPPPLASGLSETGPVPESTPLKVSSAGVSVAMITPGAVVTSGSSK